MHWMVALIDGMPVASTDHVLCPRDCHNVAASMRTRPESCGTSVMSAMRARFMCGDGDQAKGIFLAPFRTTEEPAGEAAAARIGSIALAWNFYK
jgi:hypothetical protein